jgi:preprotein translocase subunit SecD
MPQKKEQNSHKSAWVAIIAGFIAFFCFLYIFYNLKNFMSNLFVDLLILVVGIVCVLVVVTEGGSVLSGES